MQALGFAIFFCFYLSVTQEQKQQKLLFKNPRRWNLKLEQLIGPCFNVN